MPWACGWFDITCARDGWRPMGACFAGDVVVQYLRSDRMCQGAVGSRTVSGSTVVVVVSSSRGLRSTPRDLG
jgi:hypothetical protein